MFSSRVELGKLYSLLIQLSSGSSICAHNRWHHVTHYWWSHQQYHLQQGHWHPHLSSSSVLTSQPLQNRSPSQSTLATSSSLFWRLKFPGKGRWNGVFLWTTWIVPRLFAERSPGLHRTDVLNNRNLSNQRSERIPLVLTYHPLNERIQSILLRNSKILSSDPETRAVFPQPPLVAYRRDSNLRDILVHTSDSSQPSSQAGTSPCLHARSRTCQHISSATNVRGPQYPFVIKKAFSCQTSDLVYCISCRRCPAVYIGETGRQ